MPSQVHYRMNHPYLQKDGRLYKLFILVRKDMLEKAPPILTRNQSDLVRRNIRYGRCDLFLKAEMRS
jgi:hypothetical protein